MPYTRLFWFVMQSCWFLQCCFFFVGRKFECTKIHDFSEMAAEFYAAPHFWVHKKVWPLSHLHQPTPSNKWPVPKHSTSAPLFKLPVNFRILRWCRERLSSPVKSKLRSSENVRGLMFLCISQFQQCPCLPRANPRALAFFKKNGQIPRGGDT